MKRTILFSVGILGLVVSLAVAAMSQGLYWESKTQAMGKEVITKTSYMPGMMRVEGDKEFTVMRLDQEKMYMVHPEKKTYRVMTFAELEAQMKGTMAKFDKQMEKLKEQMKDMPEEQRKMVEKMMGQNMPGKSKEGKVEVEPTGDTKTIVGRICTKYVIKSDGKQVAAVWATKDMKEFAFMRKDMEQYSRRFLAMQGNMGKGIGEGINKVGGFPMEIEIQESVTTTVTKVETRTTPESAFEVPAGYTQEEVKMPKEGKEKE